MRKCGNCGEPGHNRRTCPQLEVVEEVEQEEELFLFLESMENEE